LKALPTGPRPNRIVGFIPARAESSRFPGKPLADILGKPMIVQVLQRVAQSPLLDDVWVATDSEAIFNSVRQHHGKAVMTATAHPSGSDRVAEAARHIGLQPDDIVVNIQGDQPLLEPTMIEEVARPLLDDPYLPMSTLIYRIVRDEEINHPNAVKTTFDRDGFALYFSRATIPHFGAQEPGPQYYKHHGIYGYRNDFLQAFARLAPSPLEIAERLEQLRALEHGYRIKVIITDKDSIEVDTPQDLERVRAVLARERLT